MVEQRPFKPKVEGSIPSRPTIKHPSGECWRIFVWTACYNCLGMKIAFIGQKGLELGEKGGGIEQHVAALSRHLVLFGHEVVVYGRRRYGGEQERTRVNKGGN